MPDPTLDDRTAAKLGMMPQQVAIIRAEWERTPNATVIKAFFETKLQILMLERQGKLETCAEADLKTLQGEIRALRIAVSVVSSPIVT